MPRIDHIHFIRVGTDDNPGVALTNGNETGIVGRDEVQRLMRELREAAGIRCGTCRLLLDEDCSSGQNPQGYCPDWEAKS